MRPIHTIPPIIDMVMGEAKFKFYVDKERRRVSGIMYLGRDRVTARIRCSREDVWDPLIGISLCKLKLENKMGYIRVSHKNEGPLFRGWSTIKDTVERWAR